MLARVAYIRQADNNATEEEAPPAPTARTAARIARGSRMKRILLTAALAFALSSPALAQGDLNGNSTPAASCSKRVSSAARHHAARARNGPACARFRCRPNHQGQAQHQRRDGDSLGSIFRHLIAVLDESPGVLRSCSRRRRECRARRARSPAAGIHRRIEMPRPFTVARDQPARDQAGLDPSEVRTNSADDRRGIVVGRLHANGLPMYDDTRDRQYARSGASPRWATTSSMSRTNASVMPR
jgi:hypothetical protein